MINPAAPKRGFLCGGSMTEIYSKPPCPAVLRRGLEAGNNRTIMDFHCLGVNARSCTFQQSKKNYLSLKYRIPSGSL